MLVDAKRTRRRTSELAGRVGDAVAQCGSTDSTRSRTPPAFAYRFTFELRRGFGFKKYGSGFFRFRTFLNIVDGSVQSMYLPALLCKALQAGSCAALIRCHITAGGVPICCFGAGVTDALLAASGMTCYGGKVERLTCGRFACGLKLTTPGKPGFRGLSCNYYNKLLHVSGRQLNTWRLPTALMLLLSAWGGLWDL